MTPQLITVHHGNHKFTISIKQRDTSGHLILFLHGIACAKESYDKAFDSPHLRSYSLCTLDFLGFGSSDKPNDFSYKLEDQAEVVKQVVNILAPKKISIVAHSVGGAIGILLARELPNLIHFINVEGNLVGDDCGLITRGTAAQSFEEYEQNGFQNFLKLLTSSDRKDFHEWAKWYSHASPFATHATACSVVKWSDSGKLLTMFNELANKAYLYGDEEPKDYLLPLFKEVGVYYLPRLGHFMMVEDPATFYSTILSILSNEPDVDFV